MNPIDTTPATGLQWRKSSRCGTSTCVEVAVNGDTVLVRDSKSPDGEPLHLSRRAWDDFQTAITTGQFADL